MERPEVCIWTNDDGIAFMPSLPLMCTEYYFPDINDTMLPFVSLFLRDNWDMARNKCINELSRFS